MNPNHNRFISSSSVLTSFRSRKRASKVDRTVAKKCFVRHRNRQRATERQPTT